MSAQEVCSFVSCVATLACARYAFVAARHLHSKADPFGTKEERALAREHMVASLRLPAWAVRHVNRVRRFLRLVLLLCLVGGCTGRGSTSVRVLVENECTGEDLWLVLVSLPGAPVPVAELEISTDLNTFAVGEEQHKVPVITGSTTVVNHGSARTYGVSLDGRMWQFSDHYAASPAGRTGCGHIVDTFARFREKVLSLPESSAGTVTDKKPDYRYWFVTEDGRCAEFWLDNGGSLPAAQFVKTSLEKVGGVWYLVGTVDPGDISMYSLSITSDGLKTTKVLGTGAAKGTVQTMYSSEAGCLLSTVPTQTGEK